MRLRLALLALATGCCMAGCSSEEVILAHTVKLMPADPSMNENQLLDVAVAVFATGVPEGQLTPTAMQRLNRAGTFVQVRRTESVFLAVQLRDALQDSGRWGSVWVTPQAATAADLNVTAKILQSDGDIVRLHVKTVDATGRIWIDKDYELETAAGAYDRRRYPNLDPYQDVFNEIANDLAEVQQHETPADTTNIRRVGELRYADDLSPEAFASYLSAQKGDRYELLRLPASRDPVFDRTQRVRQREHVFLDTLNGHYTSFASQAKDSYDAWRASAREESITIHELRKSARWRTGFGVVSMLASVLYGGGYDNFSSGLASDTLTFMGASLMNSGALRLQEAKQHTESLEELSNTFDDSVHQLVVDINGTQHRLSGTLQAQYEEWRDLLRQMFVSEATVDPEDLKILETPIGDGIFETPGSASGKLQSDGGKPESAEGRPENGR